MNGSEILENANTCRSCLSQAPNFINIFDSIGDTSINKALEDICGIEISLQDNKPHVICNDCLEILKTCANFRERTQQTDQTLHNILEGNITVLKDVDVDYHVAPIERKTELIEESSSSLTCPYCSKTFVHRRNLQIHKQRHFMVGKYGCPSCTQRFHTKFDLMRHLSTSHLVEKPYKCEECSQRFPTKPELNRHQKLLHSPIKSFSCSECGMQFKLKANAKQHILLVHSKERSHDCGVCGKAFAFAARLRAHQMSKCERPIRINK